MSAARVRYCTYCRNLTIFAGRADDHISVFVAGDVRHATLNAEELLIGDGICEQCREKLAPVCPICKHPHLGSVCKHTERSSGVLSTVCTCTYAAVQG